ncbi:MAG: 23S rRNA (guanosine(2251)-2'-O)-methyltransferase RlmB [Actinomycetota bacterium]
MPRERPSDRNARAHTTQRRARPAASRQRLLVDGRRVVLEAIAAGRASEILAPRRTQDREVLTAAEAAGVPVRIVELGDREEVSARVEVPPELSERELASMRYREDAIAIVLDGITDPQNLGAAARSAEAAGAQLLVTRDRRAAPTTAAAVRASAGALFHLPLARVANIARAIARLQELGFTAIGLDERAERTIYEAAAPEGRVALVVGAEDRGLSRLVRERCDELVALPMRGRVSSLNASAALSAALFGFVLPSRPDGSAG